MNHAVRDCVVTGFDYLIPTIDLPDQDDRQVVAAAIHSGASLIVTFNLKDFPPEALKPYNPGARHPDDFIFDSGAASAVAAKLIRADVIAYCHTGSEDEDNARFMMDCEAWFGQPITHLRNGKWPDTWAVWEKRRFINGPDGAPCTGELKVAPRIDFQMPGDVHVFGYTADFNDERRAKLMRENWPDLNVVTHLIDRGTTKAACLAMIKRAGIKLPRVYAMGPAVSRYLRSQ